MTNHLRFPGQYYDLETGLHYNYHRNYDPQTGRYTQVDPIGVTGGDVNLYAYVWNNPIQLLDPFGLSSEVCVEGMGPCIAQKMEEYVNKGVSMDCADAALTALIECAAQLNVPLSLPVAIKGQAKKFKYLRSKDFPDTEAFAKAVRKSMGAITLFDRDRITIPRSLEQLKPGDLILFDLRHQPLSQRRGYQGHTMVVIENDSEAWFWPLTVGEGHLSGPVEDSWYSYWASEEGGEDPWEGREELGIAKSSSKEWKE